MLRERDDRHPQPVRERQRAEQRIELRSAIGGVEADGGRSVRDFRRTPEANQVPFGGEPGCRDRLCAGALLDFRLGRAVRNLELELDEKLHHGFTVTFLPVTETTHQAPPKWTKPCPFTSPAFLSCAKK